jgi:cullin-associated NEDD8-dissociated protein 1
MVMSPDFHAANEPTPLLEPRPQPASTVSLGRPYKALVVLFLQGGLDSWNLLVPKSGCIPGNFTTNYEQYERTRGIVAIPQDQLLSVNAPTTSQAHSVCSTFGVHPALTSVQSLYNAGDAAFLANTGTLVRPLTKAQFSDRSIPRPPSLFAHNIQVRCTQSVHAQSTAATGVLGRVVDALVEAPPAPPPASASSPPPPPSPFKTGAYSLAGIKKMLDGERPPNMLDQSGAVRLSEVDKLRPLISNMTSGRMRSVFVDTFASMIESSIDSSERLGNVLESVSVQSTRWTDTDGNGRVNNNDNQAPHRCLTLCRQFEQVARVIASRSVLEEERQVFYLELGGFDTHSSALETVQTKLEQINVALTAFADEMRLQGVWDQVAVLTSSDFARTLDSNGAGTDHAWGGNYMLLGGGVRGGTIHGEYPTSYLPTSSVHIGRGRLMPTTSWEAVWHGIADWFGVPLDRLNGVVPNAANFATNQLYTKDDLFSSN